MIQLDKTTSIDWTVNTVELRYRLDALRQIIQHYLELYVRYTKFNLPYTRKNVTEVLVGKMIEYKVLEFYLTQR